ncbi:MAG: hypothetical protein SGILL_010881 [Bacillariaceae sp.]
MEQTIEDGQSSNSIAATDTARIRTITNQQSTIDYAAIRNQAFNKSNTANHITSISMVRKATTNKVIGGCGVSFKVAMDDGRSEYFFKSQSAANISHFDAESHLQEVAACQLSTSVLHWDVVPTCRGFRLYERDLQHVHEPENDTRRRAKFRVKDIFRLGSCNLQKDSDGAPFLSGSLMDWSKKPLQQVTSQTIVAAAATSDGTNATSGSTLNLTYSAVEYATFHYLGACMKSDHNHFATMNDGGPRRKKFPTKFVAIDNDRCFTLRGISSNTNVPQVHRERISLWEDMVLRQIPCHNFPDSVVERILNLAKAKKSSDGARASDLLMHSIRHDVLSKELLSFFLRQQKQSEAALLLELDERIEVLANRFTNECHFGL